MQETSFVFRAAALAVASLASAHGGTNPYFDVLTGSKPIVASGDISEFNAAFNLPTGFTQQRLTSVREIAADITQSQIRVAALGSSGSMWDMSAFSSDGRYIFTPAETQYGAGLMRYDTQTDKTVRMFQGNSAGAGGNWALDYGALDPAVSTPWGSIIVAEEWSGQGRLFEITNTTANLGADGWADGSGNFAWRNGIPSVSHEGIKFDAAGNMYFVDEFDGGSIYKFTPSTSGDLSVGQTFVLKVGAGGVDGATGAATWVPITDAAGVAITTANPYDFNSRGGRAAADEVLGTGYNRPEDLEIGTLESNGNEVLYIAVTGGSLAGVVAIDLQTLGTSAEVKQMALASTAKNLGLAATTAGLNSPDNLAIDPNGNLYLVEDAANSSTVNNPGGDVWFVRDVNGDGIAESLDLYITQGVSGAEATGMIWNPANPNQFIINIQHPGSTSNFGNTPGFEGDSTWLITVPEPSSALLGLVGVLGLVIRRRR